MAADDPRFDALLLNLAQQQQDGIDGLLGAFFGFLRRKTDFFTGQPQEVVKQTLLKAIERQMALVERTAAAKAKPSKSADSAAEVVEVGTDGAFDTSSVPSAAEEAPAPAPAAASASSASPTPPVQATATDSSPGMFAMCLVVCATHALLVQLQWAMAGSRTSTRGHKRCRT